MSGSRSRIAGASAPWYGGISLALALGFQGVARWMAEAPPMAVWGGTVWVFFLSLIVTMPLVTGWIARRSFETGDGGSST